MITVDFEKGVVAAAVIGEFTLEDFTEFEEFLIAHALFEQKPSLLFDLREMAGFTVDMAVEEIKFSRLHGNDFRHIAIVTDSQWVAWSAWLERLFVSADLRVFADLAEARAWLADEVA